MPLGLTMSCVWDGEFGVFSAMRRLTVVIVTFWIVFPIARRLTMTSLAPGRSPALRRVLFVLVPLGHRQRWVGGLANPLSASGRDAPNLVIGIILLGVVISVRVILPLNLLNSCFLGLAGRSMVILVLSKFSSGLSRCNSACGRCCIMANLLDRLFFAWLLVGLPPVRLLLGLGAVSLVCVCLAFWRCWISAGPVFGAVALSVRLPSFLTLARLSESSTTSGRRTTSKYYYLEDQNWSAFWRLQRKGPFFVLVIYPSSHNDGSVKNGCISNRIVTFQILRHFPLNHDYGGKSITGRSVDPW